MNWIDIDAWIISLIKISKDKKTLYKDVKNRFNWNDSQVKAAVDPLYKRWKK